MIFMQVRCNGLQHSLQLFQSALVNCQGAILLLKKHSVETEIMEWIPSRFCQQATTNVLSTAPWLSLLAWAWPATIKTKDCAAITWWQVSLLYSTMSKVTPLFVNYQVRHSLITIETTFWTQSVSGTGELQVEKPGSISSASRPANGKSP